MESVIYRTIKNKSSTFRVRGRAERVFYWCFNKVSVYFWLNFTLKREQEIAVESMLMTQDILVMLPTAYVKSSLTLQTYVITSGQWNNTDKGACLFTSIVKDQIAKAQSLGIKCASLVDINFDSFSSAKLYQQWISRLHVVTKRFTIFLRNLSCQSSYFRWKLIDLLFSAVSGVEIQNLQRSELAHFLVSQLHHSISCLRLRHTHLCSNVSLLVGYQHHFIGVSQIRMGLTLF